MSVWAKKFKQLLDESEENAALKARVDNLEELIEKMSSAFGNVMKSYVDLAKVTINNRKGLEDVLAYLTSNEIENEIVEDNKDHGFADERAASPEELAERKRTMN